MQSKSLPSKMMIGTLRHPRSSSPGGATSFGLLCEGLLHEFAITLWQWQGRVISTRYL